MCAHTHRVPTDQKTITGQQNKQSADRHGQFSEKELQLIHPYLKMLKLNIVRNGN